MLYEEVAELPIKKKVAKRMLSFWGCLVFRNNDKLSARIYHKAKLEDLELTKDVKTWLEKLGMEDYWASQHVPNLNTFKTPFASVCRNYNEPIICLAALRPKH